MPISFNGRFALNGQFITGYGVQANGTDSTGFANPTGIAGRLDLVTDPLGSGQLVCRCTVNDTDPVTAAGQRSEFYHQPASAPGASLWYWWAVMVPESFAVGPLFTVFQQHDTPDGSDLARPPTVLGRIDADGLFRLDNAYDPAATTTPAKLAFDRMLTRLPLQRGRWHDFVMFAQWSATPGTGQLKLWQNSRLVYVEPANINTYNDTQGPHVKNGVYDYDHVGAFGSRVVYSKGIVVGSGYSTFDQFVSAAGIPTAAELEPALGPILFSRGKRR